MALFNLFTTDPKSPQIPQPKIITSPGILNLKGKINLPEITITQPEQIKTEPAITLPIPPATSVAEKPVEKPHEEIMVVETPAPATTPSEENPSLQNFLPEIFELLRLGKDLDTLMIKRAEEIKKNDELKNQATKALAEAEKIRTNMMGFSVANSTEKSRTQLTAALQGYESFLAAFQEETKDGESLLRKNDTEMVARVNAMKSKISQMLDKVGGNEIFNQLKAYPAYFKRMKKILMEQRGGYEAKIIAEASNTLERTNTQDFKLLNTIVSEQKEGHIIDVFKVLFGVKINNN